jgi:catechol 2,3-dioxygenase-like lactoylglutathione lyase family enzyme
MLAVDKLMQITHVVPDQETRRRLEQFYLDVFAAQTYYEARPVEGIDRDESLILIGEVSLIPVCPTDPTSEQGRIRMSYAHRFMSLALKIPRVAEADAEFRRHGLHPRYHDPIYRDVFFMSDPSETCDVRYELCAVEMPNDLRLRPEWSAAWWRDAHPLGIEGLSSVGTVTGDLERARKLYQDLFGFEALGERVAELEGARSLAYRVGRRVPFVLEVLEPRGPDSRIAGYVERFGGGIYSVNFRVTSLERGARYLESMGLRLLGDRTRRFAIDPRDAFGAVFTFAERALEG